MPAPFTGAYPTNFGGVTDAMVTRATTFSDTPFGEHGRDYFLSQAANACANARLPASPFSRARMA